tara:strand:- start:338 stop:1129 length:792 start_codon:yes stop_codon:yes gene_type:complete
MPPKKKLTLTAKKIPVKKNTTNFQPLVVPKHDGLRSYWRASRRSTDPDNSEKITPGSDPLKDGFKGTLRGKNTAQGFYGNQTVFVARSLKGAENFVLESMGTKNPKYKSNGEPNFTKPQGVWDIYKFRWDPKKEHTDIVPKNVNESVDHNMAMILRKNTHLKEGTPYELRPLRAANRAYTTHYVSNIASNSEETVIKGPVPARDEKGGQVIKLVKKDFNPTVEHPRYNQVQDPIKQGKVLKTAVEVQQNTLADRIRVRKGNPR